jgi:hypothetical protein
MFTTSRQHPRRYCSIACEEGRSPLPESDPASEGYHLHLQGNPQSLIGKNLLANGLKRTCYSPDWHRSPADYSSRELVSQDAESETLVRKDDVLLGQVVAFEAGEYVVKKESIETGEVRTFTVDASLTVSQIRNDRWWVEG